MLSVMIGIATAKVICLSTYYGEITHNILQLSSNMPLICSSGGVSSGAGPYMFSNLKFEINI